jgi:hypothetical protein
MLGMMWAVLLGMIAFAVTVPLGGHLSDKGAPKVRKTIHSLAL